MLQTLILIQMLQFTCNSQRGDMVIKKNEENESDNDEDENSVMEEQEQCLFE
ncbi:hypothetical protein scyTo_0023952, partial [Scyliorhinus torazame]|nr:hypothetical protein [Scyliorhinus torazame]